MKLILSCLLFINVAFAQQKIDDLTVKKFKTVSTTNASKPCPVMTQTQRNALTANNSDCVYNSTSLSYNYYDGTTWKELGGGAGGISNWLTGVSYEIGDVVIQSSKIYQALTNHTSGVFATDLAASRWTEISSDATVAGEISAHIADTANPHATTKAQVGLSNVDNTSDATKNAATATLTNKTLTSPVMTNPELGDAKADSLDIDSYTTAAMNALTPIEGLTVYNSDYKSFATYNGTTWTYGFGNLTVETKWEACTFATLAWQGLGTVTNNLKCRRQGSNLEMRGQVVVGTTAGVQAQIPLPTNYGTITTSSLISINEINSAVFRNIAATQSFGSLILQPSVNYLNLMFNIVNARDPSLPLNGNTELGSGETISVVFLKIPIEGWTSNTNAWVQANSNPILTTTEFSAKVSISGVVSDENVDWIDGNCSGTYPYICTFKTSIFSIAPNCTLSIDRTSVDQSRVPMARSSTTDVRVVSNLDNGTASTSEFIINCQRASTDYTAAHSPFIIGTFAGTPKVSGVTSSIESLTFSFGQSSKTTNCTSGTCFLWQIGNGVSSVAYTGTNEYLITFGRTYSKIQCGQDYAFNGSSTPAWIEGYTSGSGQDISCENCSTIKIRTLNFNAGASVPVWAGMSCTGEY